MRQKLSVSESLRFCASRGLVLTGIAILSIVGSASLTGCAAKRTTTPVVAQVDTAWIAMADSAYEQGRVARAALLYREAAQRGLQPAVSWFNFANCMARLERNQEAVVGYQRAIALAPSFLRAHQNLAALWQREGNVEGAAMHYLAASRLDPKDANARFRLGELAQKTKDYAEAAWWFEQARRADPNSEAAASGSVQVELLAGDTSEAALQLERWLSAGRREVAWSRLLQGDLAARRNLRDEALFAYDDAAWVDSGESRSWVKSARVLARRGRGVEAAARLREGALDSAMPPLSKASLHVLAGRLRMEEEDPVGALQAFRQALRLGDPGGAEGIADLAAWHRLRGEEEAARRVEQALRLK